MDVSNSPDAKTQIKRLLNERGFSSVAVYGQSDNPVFDVGLVPVRVAWEIYTESMPAGEVPCFNCFNAGTGTLCIEKCCSYSSSR